jgi:DNA repair exonuclease SbcCD ATPase subunit
LAGKRGVEVKLVSVVAENFRSFERLAWSLPETGLHLIDGKNLDTGRNNMTGKTTLLDSVFWGLYGYLPKWGGPKGGQADAVIKRGTSKCFSDVTVQHNGKVVRVRRERPAKLRLWVDGLELAGKTADLDTRITELVGMSANQFLISIYMPQKRTTSFFHMSDTERTQLLSTVAGLEQLDKALAKAKARGKEIELQLERQSGVTEAITQQLSSVPAELERLNEAASTTKKNYEQTMMDFEGVAHYAAEAAKKSKSEYEVEINSLFSRIKSTEIQLADKLKTLIDTRVTSELQLQNLPTVESEYTSEIERLKKELKQAEAFNSEVDLIARQNERARDQIAREIDLAESAALGKCSHCKQKLPPADREIAAAQHIAKAQELEKKIVEVPEKIALDSIRQQLDQAMQAYAARKAELDQKPNEIRQNLKLVDEQILSLKRQAEQQILQIKSDIRLHEQGIKDTESRYSQTIREGQYTVDQSKLLFENAQSNLARYEGQVQELEKRLEEAKIKTFTLQKEMDEVLDLIDLFGPKGFRSICFEGLIERISERAGQLFSLMTDGVYSTRIDQVGETAKGEQRLILRPVITKGGQDVPVDDLSGGADATVALAYDVAVSEAVGDSSVLFLDEALDGLDPQGKNEAMRLLEEVSLTRAIIIIDHTSEIKSAIQNVIQITYRDESSSLESANSNLFEEAASQ